MSSAPDTARAAAGGRVVVIGGANTDIVGVPMATLVAHDSNPGHIRVSAGGVARNIAENLARLGARVSLITAFGEDDAGRALRDGCESLGIDTSASLVATGLPGAHYLAILDERHDMAVAINDMRALDLLTPEALAETSRAEALATADLVVLDTNLPAASIAWVVERSAAPVIIEPVSAAKAGRAADAIACAAAVTPNTIEAAALLGHEVEGPAAAEAAARELVAAGVGAAFVTCGALGVAWADSSGSGLVAAPKVDVANASGAGDAFCAGVAWALLTHAGALKAARAGSALAALTLADEDTVSRRIAPGAADAAGTE